MGRRFGPALLNTRLARRHRDQIDRARDLIRDRGAAAVFLGRFAAFLRALVPTLAGISQIRYRKFLIYNASGGIVWAAGYALLGYLAGNTYARVQRPADTIAAIVAGVLAVTAIFCLTWRRHHGRDSRETKPDPGPAHPEAGQELTARSRSR